MYAWMLTWLCAGRVYPSRNANLSGQIPANAQGELQGGVACLFSVSSIVGPPLMTQLFGRFSAEQAPLRFPGAAFACAALLTVGSLLLFLRAIRSAGAPATVAREPMQRRSGNGRRPPHSHREDCPAARAHPSISSGPPAKAGTRRRTARPRAAQIISALHS